MVVAGAVEARAAVTELAVARDVGTVLAGGAPRWQELAGRADEAVAVEGVTDGAAFALGAGSAVVIEAEGASVAV